MDPMTAFLIAMQAAGVVTDWYATQNQKEIGRMGTRIEQASIDSAIEGNRLNAADESLKAMQDLRKNLGSQIATQAARGTSSGAGSALTLQNNAVSTFNSDERVRRMNTLGKELNLRAQNLMSGVHQLTYETQLGQSLGKRTFDTIGASATIFEGKTPKSAPGVSKGKGNAGTALNKYSNYGLTAFNG